MKFAAAIILAGFTSLWAALIPPANIHIVYGEQSLDISWDSIPGVLGYNIYSSEKPRQKITAKQKINPTMISSGPHFAYIWDLEKGKRERKIKGYRHYITLTAVYSIKGREKESPMSIELDDNYFEGFDNVDSKAKIDKILVSGQQTPLLPVDSAINDRAKFIAFMEGPGKLLLKTMQEKINPREVGACAPISTILMKLLFENGLVAYRIEGNFINEFHTFVIINIENVEYILDFTADQFLPGVAPVFFPRDLAFLNEAGKLAAQGRPVYVIGKIFSPGQSDLSDSKSAELYKSIYETVKNPPHP